MGDEEETEERGEKGISGEGRVIGVLGLDDGTGGEGAFFRAVDGVIVWVVADEKSSCGVERHFEMVLVVWSSDDYGKCLQRSFSEV